MVVFCVFNPSGKVSNENQNVEKINMDKRFKISTSLFKSKSRFQNSRQMSFQTLSGCVNELDCFPN